MSRKVRAVDTGLIDDDIIVGGAGVKDGGEVVEQRVGGFDVCGVGQDPTG